MKFNVNKCKVMNDEVLIDMEEERDLGVTIHKSLKPYCTLCKKG